MNDPRRSGLYGNGDGSLIDDDDEEEADDEEKNYRASMEELLLRTGGGGGGGGAPRNDIMEELHSSGLSGRLDGSFARGFDSPVRQMRHSAIAASPATAATSSGRPGVAAMGTFWVDDDGPNHTTTTTSTSSPHPGGATRFHAAAAVGPFSGGGEAVRTTVPDPPFPDHDRSAAAAAAGTRRPTTRDDLPEGGGGSRPLSTTTESAPTTTRPRHPHYPRPHAGAPRGSTVRPMEPSAPPSRLGRRILTSKPERQPDFIAASLDRPPSPLPQPPLFLHHGGGGGGTSTTMITTSYYMTTHVECPTCANGMFIPKSTVLVLCPVCDEVNPVARCRVVMTTVDG